MFIFKMFTFKMYVGMYVYVCMYVCMCVCFNPFKWYYVFKVCVFSLKMCVCFHSKELCFIQVGCVYLRD